LKLGVLQYTSPQCPPILGYHAASRPECGAFNNGIERVAGQYHVSTVIMVADWSAYIRRRKVSYEDVAATVTTLQGSGLRVILVGQSPKFSFAYPDEYFFSKFARTSTAKAYYAPLNADPDINAHISATAHADVFYDPLQSLCRGTECIFKEGQRYLVADYGHWTHYGSELAVRELIEMANRPSDPPH
jgi:hypothetical protein